MVIFPFHFFCQWSNLALGCNVSSLQESHWTEDCTTCVEDRCVTVSLLPVHCGCRSLSVYTMGTSQPQCTTTFPLHPLFIHLLASPEMQGSKRSGGSILNRYLIGMISVSWGKQTQLPWIWYADLITVKIIQVYLSGRILQIQSQFGPLLKFLLHLWVTK